MNKILSILIVMTTVLYGCGQKHKVRTVEASKELEKSTTLIKDDIQIHPSVSEKQNVDTKYVYVDTNGQNVIIENSYPRGGLKYEALNSEKYVYAVFWTRITNETNKPFEFEMNFPEASYKLTSSPGKFFKLFIPSDIMTASKESLFNYGLDLEKYLDNNFYKRTEMKRTIDPKESSGFYFVTLFNKGVDGTLRTGLSIKNQKLIYRINDKGIDCGSINFGQLKLKE